MVRILLVEDNDAVAKGLHMLLRREGFEPLRAATAREAGEKIERADAVILDIRLPDGDGFDLCRRLRARGCHQPILMLTAKDELVDKIVGLEVGADDYLTKPFAPRELLARLRAQLRRSYGEYADDDTPRLLFGNLTLDLGRQQVTRDDEPLHLTTTEFRILSFLARHPNRPHSRDRLLDEVWGYDAYVGDPRTVDVHIRNLRQKIEPDPADPRWVVTVRGAGYMFAALEEPAG